MIFSWIRSFYRWAHVYFFFIVPLRLATAMLLADRHFISYLMLLELGSVGVFIALSICCPPEWIHVSSFVLVMGAREGALGLAIIVKLSRSRGGDRRAVSSLLRVRDSKI